jgi:hypothetical protein
VELSVKLSQLLLCLVFVGSALRGAEWVVVPSAFTLHGPQAQQHLLVGMKDGTTWSRLGENATYVSKNPGIATVDETGRVITKADGTTEIIVSIADKQLSVTVTVSDATRPKPVSYINAIQPILTRAGCNMGSCHGALAGKGGFKLSLRGYDPATDYETMTLQALGRRITVEQPAASLLLKKAMRSIPHGGGERIAPESADEQLIERWIREGTPDDTTTAKQVMSLQVHPQRWLSKPNDSARVTVSATYSDGTTADVTHWAKYSSTVESVATIDPDGNVTVVGPGESTIAVLFGTQVATATITVPRQAPFAQESFATQDASHPIDSAILAKLKELNIPPSGTCTENEFVRRSSLAACGKLPDIMAVQAYLADNRPSAAKRAAWIDTLLQSDAYVDYWTYQWADLFLVSTRKLSQESMLGFHRYLRNAVAQNHGWDRIARGILEAKGSTITQGGGAYYVIHKDVTDLVESSAVTFLGMSITCARCHNHPLERWTQNDYWAMANLFSRVGLKQGTRSGEVLVQSLSSGDALHPRLGLPMRPQPLDGPALELTSAEDRRSAFAEWLTSKDNPYFAKAMVNRVWKRLMGRGLVEAEDDFRATNPATHPALLDALAADFIAHGYDLKHLMRSIMASQAFQRSTLVTAGNETDDRYYSRYTATRLPAAIILDAYTDVLGVPTTFGEVQVGSSGGTAKSELYPLGTRAVQLPDSLLVSQFLDTFGRAERSVTCSCEVTTESSVGQALHLSNGTTLNTKLNDAKSLNKRWQADNTSTAVAIEQLYLMALARKPTAQELAAIEAELTSATTPAQRYEILDDVVWAVLSSNEFLFNH